MIVECDLVPFYSEVMPRDGGKLLAIGLVIEGPYGLISANVQQSLLSSIGQGTESLRIYRISARYQDYGLV